MKRRRSSINAMTPMAWSTKRRGRRTWSLLAAWSLVLAMLALPAPHAAAATTYVVDDTESSCSALPVATSWDSGLGVCWLEEDFTLPSEDRIEIEHGAQLRVRPGVQLVTEGTLVAGGNGALHVHGTWTNRGLARFGFVLVPDGGRISNRGEIRGGIAIDVRDGGIVRSNDQLNIEVRVSRGGEVYLSGHNEVPSFFVSGYVENSGVIDTDGTSTLDGTFRNDGTLDIADATFRIRCGRITGTGDVVGTPERLACFTGSGNWRHTSNWNGGFKPNNSETAYIEGDAVIVDGDSIGRSASTFIGGTLRIAEGGTLTNGGRVWSFNTNGRKLFVEGIINNHDEIDVNGIEVAATGGIRNWGTISALPGGFVNHGGVVNFVSGTVDTALHNEDGARFSNFGDLTVRPGSDNSGFVDIGPLGSLTVNTSFTQWGGAVLQNRGLLLMEGRLFAQMRIWPEAVLHNTADGTIEIVESGDLLRNEGNVQNDGAIVNDGRASNDGSWCGTGTIEPNGVTGTPPVTSCLPSFSVGATTPVDEGSPTTIADTFLDPGANTDFETEVVWGDGTTGTLNLIRPSPVDLAFEADHVFDDDGSYVVEVELCDPDEGCVSEQMSVEVRNVPPTVVLTPPPPVDEGSVGVLQFTATDVGNDELSVSPDDVQCGTLAEYVEGSLTFDGTDGSFSCRYLDGPLRPLAGIDVYDDDGGRGFARTRVTVMNVGPSIASVQVPSEPVLVGVLTEIRAPFADPGLDSHTASWTWDDGNSSSAGTVDHRLAFGSHAYASAGFYHPAVEVTDEDGATDQKTASDHLIVYDPDAGGLVLGGRWTTPAGAFIGDPDRSVQVNIRSQSRYLSGDSVPSGFVELRDGGDTLLVTDAFSWLVIVEDQAWLAGSALWEGSAGHTMLLAVKVVEDGPPLLRLRVIAPDGGVVFDTHPGAELDGEATVPLDRGRATIGR